jgi:integrase/recombinase XerD
VHAGQLHSDRGPPQCHGMTTFTPLAPAPPDPPEPFTDRLRLAVTSYLARFKGSSREHTESDLRCYLSWCAEHGLDPLAARRPHLELYIRSMQEIRRFKPSTVSRRFSVTAGFYRTCALDGILEHSPAEHVRRPAVPAESPTLGFTHLQFEALLTAARESPNPYDFALVAMLGLLGLRIFEAPARTSPTSAKSTATGCCACAARAPRSSWSRCRQPSAGLSTRQQAPESGGRSFVTTMLDAGVDLRDVQIAARDADPRTTMRYDRARQNLDRHPNHILAAYMASGT